MSKKPQYDPEEIRYPEQRIVESPLVPEMKQSYIEYAMSVIKGRALPDVRGGLKRPPGRLPVHRGPPGQNLRRDAAGHRKGDGGLGPQL